MAVNFPFPTPEKIRPVAGVALGTARAGIKKPNRRDLLVVSFAENATVAGVFTLNRFCAAPVQLCKNHLAAVKKDGAPIRALAINTGNANAGTGQPGLEAAQATCVALARQLDCSAQQILPFSTGVILEPLPVDRLIAGLPAAVADLNETHWLHAAEAIVTTDTVSKAASKTVTIDGHLVTVTGIAKGSGMIHPNMATMLGFLATDAAVAQEVLERLVKDVADQSFNSITVDGDTSTNDSFILIASSASPVKIAHAEGTAYSTLAAAVTEVAQRLAQMIVRDGEGATKFMTVRVEGGKTLAECRQIAYAISHSPLVKTAFFASDPNLGRILAAIGYAGVTDLEVGRIDLYLDDVRVAHAGGRDPAYREEDGQRIMQQAEITIRVVLGRGDATATVWTCDLSHEYVSINADYRS